MLTSPPDPTVDAEATRRAFLKKVAIGGAAVAIGTQVSPLRAFAQEGGDSTEGDDTGEDGGDATDDGTPEGAGEGGSSETTQPGTGSESETEPELTADEQRVSFLAGIGLAAAIVYRAASGDEADPTEAAAGEEDAATPSSTTTTLPSITVPPLSEPVVEVLRVFGSHHAQQATGLNGLLATANDQANATLVAEVRGSLGTAADEAAVLTLLRELEERIAATHLQALADLEDANDAKLVATALPVVGQHAVVLGQIGPSPVPLEELVPEEQTTEGALTEADYPAGETAAQDTPGQPSDEDPEETGGGEGADPDTGTEQNPDDGTEQSGGGATGGSSTDSGGSANDPESEG